MFEPMKPAAPVTSQVARLIPEARGKVSGKNERYFLMTMKADRRGLSRVERLLSRQK